MISRFTFKNTKDSNFFVNHKSRCIFMRMIMQSMTGAIDHELFLVYSKRNMHSFMQFLLTSCLPRVYSSFYLLVFILEYVHYI